ncbi:MAG: cytochrome P450, partial [Marmoricola sp.]
MTLPPVHEVRGRAALRSVMDNQLTFFRSTYTPGQDVVRVSLGPAKIAPEIFITHSPEAAELLLSAKSYANFPKENRVYKQIRRLLGDGILTAWGEDWRRQKTLVQPIFTRTRVEGYLDQILEEIDGLAQNLRGAQGPVDLNAEMTHFTLKVVCRVLFGTDLGDREAIVNEEFPRINRSMIERAMMLLPLPLGVPTPSNRRASSSQTALYELCDSVIAERRQNPGVGDDLTSLLVAALDGDDRFTVDDVRDQILIFLLAGHETTSTSLTFALHLLGRHPDIQTRLRDEVSTVLGT